MHKLEKNEVLYVVGNLPELGAWNHNQAVQMTQEHGSRDSPMFFENSSSREFYNDDAGNSLLRDEDE